MASTKKTPFERLLSKAVRHGECLIWTGGIGNGGYGTFHYKGKNRSAHRVSYELHKGQIPDGMEVMHTCDNRKCIDPDHLVIGSHKENMHDMIDKGRAKHIDGQKHHNAKASPEIAAEIRRRYVPCHGDRARLANVVRRRGRCVNGGLTKIHRRSM